MAATVHLHPQRHRGGDAPGPHHDRLATSRGDLQHLVGLLTATGLRIGEAINLDLSDVDRDDALLLIRESRFGKSRLVPLHPSTMRALADYAELREELQPRPHTPSFPRP